jgi:4-diphosphocytidyl-2C-methyl-D-erythritol kinase
MFRDWNSAARNSVNDFEPVMRRRHKEIDALLSRAARGDSFYRMSGSGSTVFKVTGVGPKSLDSAAEASALDIPEGTRLIVTRTAESVVPVELLD